MPSLDRLDGASERLADFLERRRTVLLGLATLLYFGLTGSIAARRPLWYDELFTQFVAGLSGPSEIWGVMKSGLDSNPPLYHLAAHFARLAFGDGPVALRLPAMAGYWVMSLCLYRLAARRSGALFGWLALLIPITTEASKYAYEARPYGLLLGLGGLSLVFWQAATEPEERRYRLAAPGLAVVLAAALATHFYAVLLFVPLAAAELVRAVERRRLDVQIGLAFAAGASALLPLKPLIDQAKARVAGFWAKPVWANLPTTYSCELLSQTVLPLLAGAVLLALLRTNLPGKRVETDTGESEGPARTPRAEVVAYAGFVALPIVAMVLGKFVTGVYATRYVLPSVLGLSLLATLLASRLARGRSCAGAGLVLIFLIWSGAIGAYQLANANGKHRALDARIARLAAEGETGTPIVVADPIQYFQLDHYSPPPLANRLVYVAFDATTATTASAQRELRALKRRAPLNVVELGPFRRAHPRFLVSGSLNDDLIALLLAEGPGVRVQLLKPDLFLVEQEAGR